MCIVNKREEDSVICLAQKVFHVDVVGGAVGLERANDSGHSTGGFRR